MGKDVIGHYLDRYAEKQARAVSGMPGHYDVAAVIPAFDESAALLDAFLPAMQREKKILVVLVINAPDTLDCRHPALARNAALEEQLACRFPVAWRGNDGLTLYGNAGESGWLSVDCTTAGRRLPPRRGVGLARKTGADIVCALFHGGKLADPWFCSTDADVLPPADLFEFCRGMQASALTFAFRHRWEGDASTRMAARLYDFFLHYHVWGLATAGSPYAHYSIGSTLALHARCYAQVRGFPRRAAGEDFHLAAKLAKLAPVHHLAKPEIVVRARASQRVPFGTGPAIARIRALPDALRTYRFANPECFAALSAVLSVIPALYESASPCLAELLERRLPASDAKLASTLLEQAGIGAAIQRARRDSSSLERFVRHVVTWFDALKTQQFLSAFRHAAEHDLTLQELLEHPLGPHLPRTRCQDEIVRLESSRAAMAKLAGELLS